MFKMNLNLFGKKSSSKAEASTADLSNDTLVPPMNLFIDNTPPSTEPETKQVVTIPNKLSGFLGRDYYTLGKRDGYQSPSQETFEIWCRKTKSEFQLIMDLMIQEKSELHLKFLNHLVGVGSIHETTAAQLRNTLEELNASIDQLNKQKELSADSEGWIMNAIHGYHEGFTQGLNDYMEGELLLKSIKNF